MNRLGLALVSAALLGGCAHAPQRGPGAREYRIEVVNRRATEQRIAVLAYERGVPSQRPIGSVAARSTRTLGIPRTVHPAVSVFVQGSPRTLLLNLTLPERGKLRLHLGTDSVWLDPASAR